MKKKTFILFMVALLVPSFVFSEQVPQGNGKDGTLTSLKKMLDKREKQMQRQLAQIESRERDIREKEKMLNGRILRYESVIAELQGKLKKARKYNSERVKKFKSIYEKMDEKKAAAVLNKLSMSLTAEILAEMRNEQAAAILNQMNPTRARLLTEQFLKGRLLTSYK